MRAEVSLLVIFTSFYTVGGQCGGPAAWQDGATDVVVVWSEDGLQATQWRAQVGRDLYWWDMRAGKEVLIVVNNQTLSKRMILCPTGNPRFQEGDAHSMSSEDLEDYLAPYLQSGQNEAAYYIPDLNGKVIFFSIFLIHKDQKLVVTDVDGTITREDVMGFVLPSVVGITHHQPGVIRLLSEISQRGYQVVYLTARSMALHEYTWHYIFNQLQEVGGFSLPDGPVFHLPRSLISSIRDPAGAIQKTTLLLQLWQCFQSDEDQDITGTIVAAYGNNANDLRAYSRAGINNIFIVNTEGVLHDISTGVRTTYSQQVENLDRIFPRLAQPQN